MNLAVKAALALSLSFLTAFATASSLELSFGLGRSDTPVTEYNYSDGSTKSLIAGNGFGFMINQKLTDFNAFELSAGAGLQWGSISDDTTSISYNDRFSYIPTELNVSYHLSNDFAVKGGLSYLVLPTYSTTTGNYEAKFMGESNLGFNVSLQYKADKAYFYGKLTSNKVAYTEFSDSNGNSANIVGFYDDEIVSAIHFGLGFNF